MAVLCAIHVFILTVGCNIEPNMSGSDNANAIGHVKRIVVLCQMHVRLLLAIRPDERIHLGTLHVIHSLHSLLNLELSGLDVHYENKSVDLLDFLHGGLCGERAFDDSELVHLFEATHRLPWILWVTLLDEGLWPEEVDIIPLLRLLAGHRLLHGLCNFRGLLLAATLCLGRRICSTFLGAHCEH